MEGSLSERLNKIIKEKGIGKKELSEKAGIAQGYLSKIDHGFVPRVEVVKKLARILGIDFRELIAGTEVEKQVKAE